MTVLVLGALCLALCVLLAWRERENARERTELLDRITAPEAAQAAAFARAIDAQPPKLDTDAEDDERFGRVLADDFALIDLGAPDA